MSSWCHCQDDLYNILWVLFISLLNLHNKIMENKKLFTRHPKPSLNVQSESIHGKVFDIMWFFHLLCQFSWLHKQSLENIFTITLTMASNISPYYPILLRRVQITCEKNTDITRYLYLSHSPDRAKDYKNLGKSEVLGNENVRQCWIINLLLDILVCSTLYIFTHHFYFDS